MAITKEAKRAYDQQRYLSVIRPTILQGRHCKACEIFLTSKYAGMKNESYCEDCRQRGAARRHQNKEHYRRNREKILARIRAKNASLCETTTI